MTPIVELCLRITMLLYLAGSVGYMLYAAFERSALREGSRVVTVFAFTLHCCLLAHRIWSAQRLPLTNMYETLMFFSWLVVIVTVVAEKKYDVHILGAFALPVAFLLLAATSLLNPDVEPLLPALRSNWLLAHVVTCFLAYAAFAVACASSLFFLIYGGLRRLGLRKKAGEQRRLDLLDSLTYRMITFGFPFLTVGIVTGSVWADVSWGTYWSWDPKETWSLVTWLVYALCLHFRHVSGLRGRWAAVAAIVGFVSVVITYFGVNYLFSTLHAYA